ncbi:MAG: VPLPA-CTERM sorting domain-containing protein [Desulfuromonadales bacterium]|nr:VPLPA-CTERM sorting domain-containing protein [Desulfuromonadales bacterium]
MEALARTLELKVCLSRGSAVCLAPASAAELIDFTMTFFNETIASLGATPGTDQWTWASDSIEMNIEGALAPVPEPATMLLLGGGMAGLASVRRRTSKA